MEDLELKGGEFGQSLQHIGVDGVARALEGLARLHGCLVGKSEARQSCMAAELDADASGQRPARDHVGVRPD